jgi:branched-chain amino acid aminotransferase
LSDSILDGVTRDSLLTLAQDMGYPTIERQLSVDELKKAFAEHRITGAFGAGTAAVVAPIKTIQIDGTDYQLPEYTQDHFLYRLKDQLEKIRTGTTPDINNWNYII